MVYSRLPWFAPLAAMLACADAAQDAGVPEFQPCTATRFSEAIVHTAAGDFVHDDVAIVPNGVNSYPLLQHVGEERWDAVRDIFDQSIALGRPLVRTNSFMDGGENPARLREADGTIREQGLAALDALIAEARAFNVRLLLVLTNNWADYGGAPALVGAISPNEPLPKDAFWSDPRALGLQREYIHALVGRVNGITELRYGDDPTIFAWELANEPRCSDPVYCSDTTLVEWASIMSDELRAAGAVQPVAWGGSGHRGEHGEDLELIAQRGGVDVLTVHVYAKPSPRVFDGESARERVDDAVRQASSLLQDRIVLARVHGMPLLVEELGYSAPEHALDRDSERAAVLKALLSIVNDAGVAALPWMIGEHGRPDYDGYLVRPEDDVTLDVISCVSPHD
jgi:mannan endo-1,4-beta-mannosidase